MKFLCIGCDQQMRFEEREIPGDGTLAAVFQCHECKREMALLTNPMETRLVSSLGIKVGGRTVPEQPLEGVRSSVQAGKDGAFREAAEPADSPVIWSVEAVARLSQVPSFVRGMVKRIYNDYAKERSISEMTPEVMDRARTDLGLEGM